MAEKVRLFTPPLPADGAGRLLGPLGRENLLQSIYFCQKVGNLALVIYVPTAPQRLMYFDNSVVTIDLDAARLIMDIASWITSSRLWTGSRSLDFTCAAVILI
jgi:hypothetical protein